jgi:hypothetical protein
MGLAPSDIASRGADTHATSVVAQGPPPRVDILATRTEFHTSYTRKDNGIDGIRSTF